jgi:hypothetical protein
VNNPTRPPHQEEQAEDSQPARFNSTAKASMVNRTHRVIRERARVLENQRNRVRSLWIPMIISAALMVIFCSAIWTVLAEYDLIPTAVPDSSDQIFILLLWFFPVSAALLAMIWFQRGRNRYEDETTQ